MIVKVNILKTRGVRPVQSAALTREEIAVATANSYTGKLYLECMLNYNAHGSHT